MDMPSNKRSKITEENLAEAAKLKALWEERKTMNQAEFGDTYGLGNQSMVGHYLNGRSALNAKAAAAFANNLKCEVADFSPRLALEINLLGQQRSDAVHVGTEPSPPDGYIRLEHLSPRPAMGSGTDLSEPVHVVQHLDVLEQWVRKKVGATNPNRIKVLSAVGTSMLPTITEDDLVFVDIGQRYIDIPGIYVINVAGRLLLKKALILSDGTLILRSDNVKDYPDEERHSLEKSADTISVCGKVMAWWTLKK